MMDAQGKLMKRVDSENQVEQKMGSHQILSKAFQSCFQAERLERAESFCMDLMESGRNEKVRNRNFSQCFFLFFPDHR